MAETTREMVVRLSMDAGGFKKTASEINRQIRNIDSEIKGMGGDPGRSQLEEKLGLQQKAVENLQKAVDAARTKLQGADTDAQKLLAAKQLSGLETQLATAEAKALALKNQLSAANLIKFGTLASNFGKAMQRMGRTMSLYVSGPLMALGGKAYKTALDFESATVSMQKTIDETDTTKYADIEAAFKSLSETAPVGYTELMELAGQAGALGVSADEVVEFVKSVAMISETADDLDASTGADVLARFLNVTDQGSFENITRVASAVTALGNGLATTEGELMAMAQCMASTGELAGMSNEAILALAAGFASVGINAEAGGSAAGKLMKQMQLAGETGRRAMQEFSEYSETAGMSARDLQLAADSSEWVEATAIDLGRTKKEVKDMVASLVALEQFSGVMNVTPAQFIAGWNENAGQSVLDFFIGLNEIETSGGEESVISKLQEMGLTELRLSNLIAAAAANPELFQRAMEISNQAYEQNTALAEEAEKRYATAESYQRTQLNKMENAAADAGENLVDPIQSIMTKVSDLLSKFGELDEGTQDWILGIGAGLAVGGPAMVALGNVIKTVGEIATKIGKAKEGTSGLQTVLSNPALWGVAVGGALLLAASTISDILHDTDEITESLGNVSINIDPDSVDAALEQIAKVQEAADKLSGAELKEEYGATSAAVKAGYGTVDMFGQAVGYEKALAEKAMTDAAGEYAPLINAYNEQIAAAVADGNTDLADSLAGDRKTTQDAWDAAARVAQANYTAALSDLYNGMMKSNPEIAAKQVEAAKTYDLYSAVLDAMALGDNFGPEHTAAWQNVFENPLAQLLVPNAANWKDIDPQQWEIVGNNIKDEAMRAIAASFSTINEGTQPFSLINTLLNSGAFELSDVTELQGALDGAFKLLDYKNAVAAGEDITQGLADGAVQGSGALTPSAEAIKNSALEAIRAAFIMRSPSVLMAQEGRNIPAGVAEGIIEGIPVAAAAMTTLGAVLEGEAARQGAIIGAAMSAAFNASLNFNAPGLPTGTGQVGSTSGIYAIRKGLTDAQLRTVRGYGRV